MRTTSVAMARKMLEAAAGSKPRRFNVSGTRCISAAVISGPLKPASLAAAPDADRDLTASARSAAEDWSVGAIDPLHANSPFFRDRRRLQPAFLVLFAEMPEA